MRCRQDGPGGISAIVRPSSISSDDSRSVRFTRSERAGIDVACMLARSGAAAASRLLTSDTATGLSTRGVANNADSLRTVALSCLGETS